ncbi:GDP-L-fucose synthase [uncultured Tateyamaria sp.]|uniref:GDP-L-fucose synthase family protein n=1 Tax=uncultured Tateyamaria sp. TaxID=455651 RepID=UPI00262665D4|nr:GDP-L-fucose synthase [uncultured Tateyamaria sp.]
MILDGTELNLLGRRIWVAGHRGMVGSAVVRRLSTCDVELLTVDRADLDLRDSSAVQTWVANHRPEIVVLAAARVGGIRANDAYPVDFLFDNLAIQQAVIGAAARYGVAKLMVLGSSCIYPRQAPQPIAPSDLLTGPFEPTNQWYGVAKIAGIKLAEAFRRQHGLDFISVIPTSLYGPGDNFDLQGGHVIPALIRKAHEAKRNDATEITVWGTGEPLREFLHVDDLADALVMLLERYSAPDPINVGSGEEISIRELAEAACRTVGFEGDIRFDTSRPDGMPRKLIDSSVLATLGWRRRIDLKTGLDDLYSWFLANVSDQVHS